MKGLGVDHELIIVSGPVRDHCTPVIIPATCAKGIPIALQMCRKHCKYRGFWRNVQRKTSYVLRLFCILWLKCIGIYDVV